MLVFWKQRLVLLATPKTGSTAIEAALGSLAALPVMQPAALKHTDARTWQRYLRPYLREMSGGDFTALALIREPVDWLGSWYRSRLREDILDMPAGTRGLSFADFAEAYLHEPRHALADVGSQAEFLKGSDGTACGVDRLFRYEDIGGFVTYLEDRLDFAIELPKENVSPEGDRDLPDDLRAQLAERMAEDYALYDAIG
ncbi:hypothetical protein JI664_00230 [Rhodobacter sp. NTK016B]|uniref:sulfotransferase family 2 domain-containing protein n=1 Tax=Rhodobacter sp. NTK016B TaxID=2759676 RepID=UPI001A8DA350|nr:sulfotransferase family 2 domain-containing protein [Rhodobacter sp. NTK016B]MBN8290383.1 hypothetical protein [Rhodobacter sp. NTK016B]